MADHDTIPSHVTEVVAAEQVSDSFVRVTFGGGLDRFQPIGPDDFVYVLLPPPGRRDLPIDTSFRWTDYYAMPEPARPVGAYYTVRQFRPGAGELDCDVFLHDPAGNVSAWAPNAEPGDAAALWGPRTAWHPPSATTDWLLVAGETGLPALSAILEHRTPPTPARAYVEVATDEDRLPLPCGDGVEVTWLYRDGRKAGTTDLLADAVRRAAPPGVGQRAEQAEAYPELAGKTVAMVWNTADTFYVYKPADARVAFTLDLGFTSAPAVEQLAAGAETFYYTISHERLGELTSDVLVSYADTQEASDAFLASPAALTMTQVQRGTVAEVIGTKFIAAVSPPTALSLTWGLKDYVRILSEAADAVR